MNANIVCVCVVCVCWMFKNYLQCFVLQFTIYIHLDISVALHLSACFDVLLLIDYCSFKMYTNSTLA